MASSECSSSTDGGLGMGKESDGSGEEDEIDTKNLEDPVLATKKMDFTVKLVSQHSTIPSHIALSQGNLNLP